MKIKLAAALATMLAFMTVSCNKTNDIYLPEEWDGTLTEGTFVDLGLSVKWASVNLGATQPQEPGGLYAYGSVINAKLSSETKATASDPATELLGEGYATPTYAQVKELMETCSFSYVTYKGRPGFIVKGVGTAYQNYIFLPAGGKLDSYSETWNSTNYFCSYWCGDKNGGSTYALYLDVKTTGLIQQMDNICNSVRPVEKK